MFQVTLANGKKYLRVFYGQIRTPQDLESFKAEIKAEMESTPFPVHAEIWLETSGVTQKTLRSVASTATG